MDFDAIIIGGSYAGISAALQLARAHRRILIIDAGERRNRFAKHSHGFLGQDGREPAAIVAEARRQLLLYPTVQWLEGKVETATRRDMGFDVMLHGRATEHGKRLVLASGVVDSLPAVPGLKERWGTAVFHCPYCHGYELQMGRIGVVATSEISMHHALMLPDWGMTTLFTNGTFSPDEEQRRQLDDRGVTLETTPIREIIGQRAEVVLVDGRVLAMDGLFTVPQISINRAWSDDLGCALEEGPFGAVLRTDATKETSVRGVFACGDVARAAGNVAMAVGDGALTGAATHRSLMFGSL